MKRGDGAVFLFSAGGYHPEFAAPASFPKLERLKIVFLDSENLRLILTGYVAFTSNTRSSAREIDFFGGFGGFSFEAPDRLRRALGRRRRASSSTSTSRRRSSTRA